MLQPTANLILSIVSTCLLVPQGKTTVDVDASAKAVQQLSAHLQNDDAGPIGEQKFASVGLSATDAMAVRELLVKQHAEKIRKQRADEMKARELTLGKLKMPFFYKIYGEKPKDGRSLFISMHGGGGGPKRMNDQQYQNQQRLYQPEEGVYLAPRAPTNTWNLWHQPHIDKLFGRLIENLIVFEDVNPNKVYIMGYSAGGDGVYQLAPRMADRWAAAAMMAGHPNGVSPLSMRNIGFTLHMGGNDRAYKRNEVAAQWKVKLAEIQKSDPDGYKHLVKIHEGKGHWMDREDAVAVGWMAKFTRDPHPKKIVWNKQDTQHERFYWLATDAKSKGMITATRDKQSIDIKSEGVEKLTVRFDSKMVDFDKPVSITLNGKAVFEGTVKRTIGVIAKTLSDRGDPTGIFDAETVATPQE